MRYDFPLLVAIAADRMTRLARPLDGDRPPPARSPAEWAAVAGLEHEPHPALVLARVRSLSTEPYPPEQVATAALQRLVERRVFEWAANGRWKPTAR